MRLVLVSLLCWLAGCGSDGKSAPGGTPDAAVACTGGQTYAAGMEVSGTAGLRVALESAEPAPPARFDNHWIVRLSDAAGAVEGATLTVVPFMPAHQHGTSKPVVVTPMGGGRYDLAPVNLWMPGLWEVRIAVTSGALTDRIVFSFCIDA